MKVKGIQEKNI